MRMTFQLFFKTQAHICERMINLLAEQFEYDENKVVFHPNIFLLYRIC